MHDVIDDQELRFFCRGTELELEFQTFSQLHLFAIQLKAREFQLSLRPHADQREGGRMALLDQSPQRATDDPIDFRHVRGARFRAPTFQDFHDDFRMILGDVVQMIGDAFSYKKRRIKAQALENRKRGRRIAHGLL